MQNKKPVKPCGVTGIKNNNKMKNGGPTYQTAIYPLPFIFYNAKIWYYFDCKAFFYAVAVLARLSRIKRISGLRRPVIRIAMAPK